MAAAMIVIPAKAGIQRKHQKLSRRQTVSDRCGNHSPPLKRKEEREQGLGTFSRFQLSVCMLVIPMTFVTVIPAKAGIQRRHGEYSRRQIVAYLCGNLSPPLKRREKRGQKTTAFSRLSTLQSRRASGCNRMLQEETDQVPMYLA